jgi:hypothetical protein
MQLRPLAALVAALFVGLLLTWFAWPEVESTGALGQTGSATTDPGDASGTRLRLEDSDSIESSAREFVGGEAASDAAKVEEQISYSGRILVDGAWPRDDQLIVSAGDFGSFPVQDGGAFTLELPKDCASVELDLDGRFLFMDKPLTVDPSAGSIVMTAELGAHLTVELTPPAGLTLPELMDVEVVVTFIGNFNSFEGRRSLAKISPGVFELRAMECVHLFSITVSGESFVDDGEVGQRVHPGKQARLEYALLRGASISGIVMGFDDAPIEGATLTIERTNPDTMQFTKWIAEDNSETDAAGAFSFGGLVPSEWRLQVSGDELRDEFFELGALEDGQVLEGLSFQVSSGLAFHGYVRFPDGSPADTASLKLTTMANSNKSVDRTETSSSGEFLLAGLEQDTFRISASLDHEDSSVWRGELTGLEPGKSAASEALILTLVRADSISGTAISDDGTALDKFTVQAKPLGSDLAALSEGSLRERYRKAEGRFELEGFVPGRWDVRVEAKDHRPSAWQRVTFPGGASSLDFVLDRHAELSGRVLDPMGDPAAGVTVSAIGGDGESAKDKTNDEGEFEIDNAAPGNLELVASKEGLGNSAPLAIRLNPGSVSFGHELVMLAGGTIAGKIDASIEDFAERRILAVPQDSFDSISTLCNEQGEFEFKGLVPGVWIVNFDWQASGGGGGDWIEGYSRRSERTVVVTEGQVSEVMLGGLLPSSVALSGQVTDEGEPMAGYIVYVYPEPGTNVRPVEMPTTIARTDENGRYELELPSPGTWQFSAGPDMSLQVAFIETIASGPQATLDFEMPGCSFAGSLLRADGSPASGQAIMLVRAGAPEGTRTYGDIHTQGTDGEGKFSFEGLQAGAYIFRIGGWGFGIEGHGVQVIEGIVLTEGTPNTGFEAQLKNGGVLEGRVQDGSGNPISGVNIKVRDANGHSLFVWTEKFSDYAGAFRIRGVSSGPLTVHATLGDGRTVSQSFTCAAGETAKVVLVIG